MCFFAHFRSIWTCQCHSSSIRLPVQTPTALVHLATTLCLLTILYRMSPASPNITTAMGSYEHKHSNKEFRFRAAGFCSETSGGLDQRSTRDSRISWSSFKLSAVWKSGRAPPFLPNHYSAFWKENSYFCIRPVFLYATQSRRVKPFRAYQKANIEEENE